MIRNVNIDKVLEIINEVNADGGFTSYADYTYLFDSIDKLPTIEQPQWIPCSERLPENDTRVIVWMAWGGFSMLDYQYNHFYGLNSVNDIPDEAVAAWMPLPEPYGGENDKTD